MYYVTYPIKLTVRLQGYLELIKTVNNRHEEQRSKLARYDAAKNNQWAMIRIMNKRPDIVKQLKRWQALSEWLVLRMQSVITELNQENIKQMKKLLSTNEVQTIEL